MIERFGEGARASRAVAYGDSLVTGGIVAEDKQADISGQTRQVLEALEAILQEAGCRREQLTQVQIWLADIADFDAMNAVYDRWVSAGPRPVRATVESRLADPGYRIEIQACA